jgi:hypothetical protein
MTLFTISEQVKALEESHERLLNALSQAQFGFNHSRCPVCAGWRADSEHDYEHTSNCSIALALNEALDVRELYKKG